MRSVPLTRAAVDTRRKWRRCGAAPQLMRSLQSGRRGRRRLLRCILRLRRPKHRLRRHRRRAAGGGGSARSGSGVVLVELGTRLLLEMRRQRGSVSQHRLVHAHRPPSPHHPRTTTTTTASTAAATTPRRCHRRSCGLELALHVCRREQIARLGHVQSVRLLKARERCADLACPVGGEAALVALACALSRGVVDEKAAVGRRRPGGCCGWRRVRAARREECLDLRRLPVHLRRLSVPRVGGLGARWAKSGRALLLQRYQHL